MGTDWCLGDTKVARESSANRLSFFAINSRWDGRNSTETYGEPSAKGHPDNSSCCCPPRVEAPVSRNQRPPAGSERTLEPSLQPSRLALHCTSILRTGVRNARMATLCSRACRVTSMARLRSRNARGAYSLCWYFMDKSRRHLHTFHVCGESRRVLARRTRSQ